MKLLHRKVRIRSFFVVMLLIIMVMNSFNLTSITVHAQTNATSKISSVKLNHWYYTLTKGNSANLKVTITPASAAKSATLQWSSSDTSIVSVSSNGVIKGINKGTATITVKVKGTNIKKICKVTVGTPVSKVSVNNQSLILTVGEARTIRATISPTSASNKNVYYSSSNSAVASVNTKGQITAKQAGNTTITMKAKDGSGKKTTIKVTVKKAVAIEKVEVTLASTTLIIGETTTASVKITPFNVTNQSVTWSSDDSSVVQVDSKGMITALKEGTAIIKATVKDNNKIYGSVSITVKAPFTEPSNQDKTEVDSNMINLTFGEYTFTATLVDNSSTKALKEMLAKGPITIDMQDYGNMEKVGSFGTSLPRNDQQITTEAGDLILYQGSAFVIYYAPNSWNFTRLGKIDNITAAKLKQALGNGNVKVTLSLIED